MAYDIKGVTPEAQETISAAVTSWLVGQVKALGENLSARMGKE